MSLNGFNGCSQPLQHHNETIVEKEIWEQHLQERIIHYWKEGGGVNQWKKLNCSFCFASLFTGPAVYNWDIGQDFNAFGTQPNGHMPIRYLVKSRGYTIEIWVRNMMQNVIQQTLLVLASLLMGFAFPKEFLSMCPFGNTNAVERGRAFAERIL